MKKHIAILVTLLTTSATYANLRIGVVVAVDKKSFTITRPLCDNSTFTYDPDMGKKAKGVVPWGQPLGITPDKIKVGMIVKVNYDSKKGVLISQRVMVVVENLGTREIDFAPMLAKGKDKLPKFTLQFDLQIRAELGHLYNQRIIIDFHAGATIKEVRDCVKGIAGAGDWNNKLVAGLDLQGGGRGGGRTWKVKAVGETKLLLESYRRDEDDEPVNVVKVEAKGLPNDRQPHIRMIVEENLGTREIDFAPMLAKDKDKLPWSSLHFELQTRVGLGPLRNHRLIINFHKGASVKEVRDCVKAILSGSGILNHKIVAAQALLGGGPTWKVKAVGETKLLLECYRRDEKDEPINAVVIDAKELGFPKYRQPRVRLIDPRDPTKSLKSGKDERAEPKKERK